MSRSPRRDDFIIDSSAGRRSPPRQPYDYERTTPTAFDGGRESPNNSRRPPPSPYHHQQQQQPQQQQYNNNNNNSNNGNSFQSLTAPTSASARQTPYQQQQQPQQQLAPPQQSQPYRQAPTTHPVQPRRPAPAPKPPVSGFAVFSIVVPFIIFAFIVAAVASSDWLSLSTSGASSVRWGLFQRCNGGVCNTWDSSSALVAITPTCNRQTNEIKDRMNAVAGLILTGDILLFVVALLLGILALGKLAASKTKSIVLLVLTCLSCVLKIVGVIVYGATFNSWLSCGHEFCSLYDGTTSHCGIGYSYVFTVVSTILTGFLIAFMIVFMFMPTIVQATRGVLTLSALILLVAIVLSLIGIGTRSWVIVVPDYLHSGLFKACTTKDCRPYDMTGPDSDVQYTTRIGCTHTGKEKGGFMITSAVFLIFSALFFLIMVLVNLVLAFMRRPLLALPKAFQWVLIGITVLLLVLQLIAFLLQQNVYTSWEYCGRDICDQFTGYCEFGFSYGFIITTLVLTGVLVVSYVLESLGVLSGANTVASKEPAAAPSQQQQQPTQPPVQRQQQQQQSMYPPMQSHEPLAITNNNNNNNGDLASSQNRMPAPVPQQQYHNDHYNAAPLPPSQQQQQPRPQSPMHPIKQLDSPHNDYVSNHRLPHSYDDAAAAARFEAELVLPEGNWEFDPVSKYYWSEDARLFYDPETRFFYDPNTDQWIDTEGEDDRRIQASRQ